MVSFLSLTTVLLALASSVTAQCGAGTPDAEVTGSSGSYQAVKGSTELYSGSDYFAAIQAALDGTSSGQRVAVIASGSIGANTISIDSGKIFEGCGTIDVDYRANRGAIESVNTENVNIAYLSMTGSPYFGLRFYGTSGLVLGQITMRLSEGLGIRFDRDEAANTDVTMDTIDVSGASSHAVETWNIAGLNIGTVIARDVGECGLLIQASTDVRVGLVDGDNVGTGTGYATLRFANNAGQKGSSYDTNIVVDKVVSRGGGRGIFCVSQSGGIDIVSADLADNGGNSLLVENCYGFRIRDGTVNGGGEVRISARTEFANTRDTDIALRVDGTTIRESPCADNSVWTLTGNGATDIC
ncbi:hypothetical protein N0V93_008914 [Gnomoniopsis smithogilvyi]|uniref:Parallel beta-helix repeat protein n=1 Tax=Gnomoniopsis smithogilvyi TaxID=1191159 RepID=A0A9W9CT56_9PEZI|nr:hypothetical protein N0V93_008914 [Gnomoniopsis smithogilvyi]